MKSTGGFSWTNGLSSGTVDLSLHRDAANVLAQFNGTSAQEFRLYNTRTDASNYERLSLGWSSNILTIAAQNAGTGTKRNIVIDGANRASKINDPSGGATTDSEARTAINAIIDALEAHGISATS
jgi:hypothetical protein